MKLSHFILSVIFLGASLAVAQISIAGNDDHDHEHISEIKKESSVERDDHYEVEQPKTPEEAIALLSEKLAEIELHFQKGELEEIHKDSYALEASVDALRALKARDTSLIDSLDESVQIIHYASEQEDTKVLGALMGDLRKNIHNITQD